MRLLSVGLLFFFVFCLLHQSEARKWGSLFQSFFHGGTPGIAVQNDNPQDSIHARVKRAIYAAMGWTQNCNTGWTGTYCETPICNPEPPLSSSNTMQTLTVDRGDLGELCSQGFSFPIESAVRQLMITVSVSAGSPQVTLLDDNSIVVTTQGTVTPTASIFIVDNPVPGWYSMNVTLDGGSTTYCRVHVEVMSYLNIVGGFVHTPQGDFVEDSVAYATEQYYFIAHGFNITSPGTLGAVFVKVNAQLTSSYTSKLSPRYGCNYEYYAGFYTCQTGFYDYYWTVEGTDQQGYRFRRTKQFQCLTRPTHPTTPSPPSTPPPSSCLNGGTLVNANSSNAFCYCGEFYGGNDCAWPICMNSGVQTPTGCDCQDGFTGTFCEHLTCNNDNIGNFNTDIKTLIIVMRTSSYIVSKTADIAKVINDQLNYYGVNEITVYNSFVLVTFGNDQYNWMTYTSSDDLINAMTNVTANTNANCSDSVVDAVSRVFYASRLNNKSPIFVFTDVPADDGSDYLTVVFANTFRKFPIFVYYLADPNSNCNVDPMSPGYVTLQLLAHTSGGLVLTPDTATFYNAVKYVMRFVTYHRQWVLGYDYFQCQMGNHGSFFVDSSTKSIAIIATGTNLSIQITDPTGNNVDAIDAIISNNNNYIWDVINVVHGGYLFFITSSGGSTNPCNYRVYVESQYDLYYGVSNSLTTDAVFSEPIYNQASNMVAVFNGLLNIVSDQFRLFAEMQISRANQSGYLEPVYYSNGVYRDGCNFHLHFGSFTCTNPGEHLYVTVFADDERGYPIQRTAIAYCAYEQPTTSPPGTCLNAGVPNPYNTTTCLCPTYWTGQYCERLYCANNGTSVNNAFCQCPPFTSGRFCEEIACGTPATDVDFGFTHRSLVFVLNVQKTMAQPLADLAGKVQDFVRDLFAMHERFITQFGVIIYNGNFSEILKVTDDPFAFVASVQYAAEFASGQPDVANCTGLMDSALVLAVEQSLRNSFVYLFTDSESSESNYNYVTAMLNAQDSRVKINLIAVGDSLCGGNGYQFTSNHILMTEYTGGNYFYTTHPGNFLQYIPTQYKAGIFSGKASDTCSISTYLAVDYWAQAFTIYTGGQNLSITVTPPSGKEADFLNIIDTDTYLDIRQYIIPCDSRQIWSAKNQYCYNYILNQTTWNDAYQECHATYGAHMVHIFDDTTQATINNMIGGNSIWIGLKRVGSSSTFTWDVPNGAPINLTLSGYTNWDSSVNISDTSLGDCVIVKPGNGGVPRWFIADCSSISNTTMCQKHRFDQDYIPGREENLLPAGLWLLQISGQGTCGYEASIQSDIQVFYGFTSDIHSDQPRTYADLNSQKNRIMAHVTGLSSVSFNDDGIDGNLNYAMMYENETLASTATFQRRALCAYHAVSQEFGCPPAASQGIVTEVPTVFTGIDQYGNLFERIVFPYCSPHIVSCLHGGYLFQDMCICPPNFEGEQCENRICYNGGTLLSNGACQCTEETTGESCEYFQCVPPRNVDFSDNGKTLVILVETSYMMTTPIYRLAKALPSIVNNVSSSTDSTWFTNYILFPFDSTSNQAMWYNKTYASDIQTIANTLKTYATYSCPGDQCAPGDQCPRPILQVINDTLNDPQLVSPGSVILLFTQSSVEDVTKFTSVFNNIQRTRAQIQVIIPDITTPCSLPWNDISNTVLFSLPQQSGGDLFTVFSYDLVNVLLPAYLPSLYRSAVVDSLVVRNCSRDEILISIDSYTPELTLVYSGVNPILTLIDPTNTSISLPPNAISSAFNYFGVVQTMGKGGTYRLIATSDSTSGSCLINVHANSMIEVSIGFVIPNDPYNGATSDDAHWVAVADPTKSNVVVLHTNNASFTQINYVQLYSTNQFNRAQLFTSEVIPRSFNCSYQWVSVRGFRCDPYQFYELAVYGLDQRDFIFRRSYPVHCVPDLPPRPPTPPTCDITNRYYDIVLLLDGSSSSNFDTLKNLMISTFSPFTLDANNTRLSIIVVNGNATLFKYLKDSDGQHAQPYISAATTDGSSGQNLAAAIQLVQGEHDDSDTSGYRTGPRHLVVYATSNTNFTGEDAGEYLLALRRSGTFGFIAVGYNLNDADANTLVNFSGDACTYSDSSQNAATYIANYIQDVTCLRFPVCGEA